MKLIVSNEIVKEKTNSLQSYSRKLMKVDFYTKNVSSKKLSFQTPNLTYRVDETTNFDPKPFQKTVCQTCLLGFELSFCGWKVREASLDHFFGGCKAITM